MDPNGDGYVDLSEFRTYIMDQRMILSSRRVEKLFNVIRWFLEKQFVACHKK